MIIDFTASIVTGGGMRARIEALRSSYDPRCEAYFDDILKRRGSAFCDSASGFLLLDSLLQKNRIDRMEVPIVVDENHRPHIDRNDMDFSVSHSEGCAICVLAVGEGANVGCDVQRARNYSPEKMTQLAQTFMSEREFSRFGGSADKSAEFFTAWTRREAFVKRIGKTRDTSIFDNLRSANLSGEFFREGIISACGERYFYSVNTLPGSEAEFSDEPRELCESSETPQKTA